MFVNILFAIFVTAYIAIVAFGHVLLIAAIWPDLLRKRRDSHIGTVDDAVPLLHEPNPQWRHSDV